MRRIAAQPTVLFGQAAGVPAQTRVRAVSDTCQTQQQNSDNSSTGPERSVRGAVALDLPAAHYSVLAVVVAHPALAGAVVVRAPDDQRRVSVADLHALGAL